MVPLMSLSTSSAGGGGNKSASPRRRMSTAAVLMTSLPPPDNSHQDALTPGSMPSRSPSPRRPLQAQNRSMSIAAGAAAHLGNGSVINRARNAGRSMSVDQSGSSPARKFQAARPMFAHTADYEKAAVPRVTTLEASTWEERGQRDVSPSRSGLLKRSEYVVEEDEESLEDNNMAVAATATATEQALEDKVNFCWKTRPAGDEDNSLGVALDC